MSLQKTQNQLTNSSIQSNQNLEQLPELRLRFTDNGQTHHSKHMILEQKDRKFSIKMEAQQEPDLWMEIKIRDKNILKRNNHVCALHLNRLYVHGGYEINTGTLSDFHYIAIEEDLSMNTWISIKSSSGLSPGALQRHTGIVYRDYLYIFGGQKQGTQNTNDLWCYEFVTSKWKLIRPSKSSIEAPFLDSHTCNLYVDNEGDGSLIICCGFLGESLAYTNKVYKFDIEKQNWNILYDGDPKTNAPEGRGDHSACICGDKVYIFGGTNGEIRFDDLWSFDLVTLKWTQIIADDAPEPRSGHSMVLFENNYLVIFGGIQEVTRERDDVMAFNLKTGNWLTLSNESTFTSNISPKKGCSGTGVGDTMLSEDEKMFYKSDDKQHHHHHHLPSIIGNRESHRRASISKTAGYPHRKPSSMMTSPRGHSISRESGSGGALCKTDKDFKQVNTSAYTTGFQEKNSSNSPVSALKAVEEEKRRRRMLIQKTMLLSKFEVSDSTQKLLLRVNSPTTQAMKNSIIALNEKRNNQETKKKDISEISEPWLPAIIPVISSNGKVIGRKPCARDGHSSVLYMRKMIVFGGDRHKMSFNDIYVLNLEKAIAEAEKANSMSRSK